MQVVEDRGKSRQLKDYLLQFQKELMMEQESDYQAKGRLVQEVQEAVIYIYL